MGPTSRQLWGSPSRATTFELIKQNFKLTEELHQMKEAYVENKSTIG